MTLVEIDPGDLTRGVVEEHRRWLLNNAGDANEVDACRQFFDGRLGARRRIEAKERICASINRRRCVDAARRDAAQAEASATGMPIDPTLVAAATTTRRQQVIAAHRAEGEPQTMARASRMCDERWPRRSAIQWIEHVDAGPRRHVAVTFARERIEGAADTWLDAMDLVDEERRRRGIGS